MSKTPAPPPPAESLTITLDDLLADAASELDACGMFALGRAVQIARTRLDRVPIEAEPPLELEAPKQAEAQAE